MNQASGPVENFEGASLLHHLFESAVRDHPDATAVTFGDESITFALLDGWANDVAARLRHQGVRREDVIGVYMERSPEMVVAILAILKCGCCYLPLEPAHPAERLQKIVDQVRAACVVTQRLLVGSVPGAEKTLVIEDVSEPRGEDALRYQPQFDQAAEDLAYVIFTSGSTGRPKGAMNTHAGVRNRILWMREHFSISPDDKVLFKTPFGFDVSVWEILLPLLSGAELVVAEPGGHLDSGYIVDAIRRHEITTVHFVPSVLSIMLEEPDFPLCKSLRRVICSGEALSPKLQNEFYDALPDVALFNLYGPTEAAIDVTHWECRKAWGHAAVPIGMPIANIQMHVLDDGIQPVETGAEGELYIAGVGLARGYFRQPQETAARFVPNPFSAIPGDRMYRTGDLGKRLADGEIVYSGRNDHQIKVRGCRVEIGEVEAAISHLPAVRRALVLPRSDASGEMRLVAYVETAEGDTLSPSSLRRSLSLVLPDFMLPSAFVVMARFPLSSNGKVEFRSLPLPGPGDRAAP